MPAAPPQLFQVQNHRGSNQAKKTSRSGFPRDSPNTLWLRFQKSTVETAPGGFLLDPTIPQALWQSYPSLLEPLQNSQLQAKIPPDKTRLLAVCNISGTCGVGTWPNTETKRCSNNWQARHTRTAGWSNWRGARSCEASWFRQSNLKSIPNL